jgi:hypothetical protein
MLLTSALILDIVSVFYPQCSPLYATSHLMHHLSWQADAAAGAWARKAIADLDTDQLKCVLLALCMHLYPESDNPAAATRGLVESSLTRLKTGEDFTGNVVHPRCDRCKSYLAIFMHHIAAKVRIKTADCIP